MRTNSLMAVLCFPLALAAQTPTVAVSSVDLTINPAGTDAYSIQGSFTGITLKGAHTFVFSVGQFGASIPLSAFSQQPGTNVYQYTDTTGQSPYWLSSLTIDLDANVFTAGASGIVLSGLSNPFPVYVGTDAVTGCGMVIAQGVSAGEYSLNSGSGGTQPCAIPAAPVADPPAVPAGSAVQITITMAAAGLDANSVLLYRADDNAQPIGPALCTFADKGDGTFSCAVSFNESSAGAIPLVVQATANGQAVVAPGFSIQAVAPLSEADAQQQADIESIMLSTGDQAYDQYGDSVYARVQLMAALRQYMQPQPGLTGQPVRLSPDGSELGVRCDSGLTVIYNLSDPDSGDGSTSTSSRRSQKSVAPPAPAPGIAPDALPGYPAAQQAASCGDFARKIVANNKVLVWDPGSIFWESIDPAPRIAQVIRNSKCPHFDVTSLTGPDATVASLSRFPDYGTIIMNTHGNVDSWGRFYILTGSHSPFKDLTTGSGNPIQLGSWCDHKNPKFGLPSICYVTVYANYEGLQVAPNTIVWGGFCNGFIGNLPLPETPLFVLPPWFVPTVPVLSQWPTKMVPNPATNAFFGFNSTVRTDVDEAAGKAVFTSLLNSYSSAGGARDDAAPVAPNLNLYPFGSNLAYVGNPVLTLASLAPPPAPGDLGLWAYLDGASSCDGSQGSNLNVKWTNPARAGHLASRSSLVSGSQDNFTNEADMAVFGATVTPGNSPGGLFYFAATEYKPDASLPAMSDSIMADFYPDLANPLAARACLAVPGKGLLVTNQVATIWDDTRPALRGYLTPVTPPAKVTSTYTVPLTDPGGVKGKGGTASIEVTSKGQDSLL
jgi:hypothetical protein